ncbi:MAG: type 1 glutamine amidotransferase [Bacteroidales bacterium]|nr:type 1 glutamine amidotransferase [Bacteroidales bacterium]
MDLSKGDPLPLANECSAVFVFGGPQSASDADGHIPAEIDFIQEVIQNEIPFFGICLGLQLMVKATGGNIIACERKEIGWWSDEDKLFSIYHSNSYMVDDILQGINNNIPIFQLHGETVKLTPKHRLVAQSSGCENQFVRYGKNAYGIQGHLELTEEMLKSWILIDKDLKKKDIDYIMITYEAIKREYNEAGTRLFWNFLKLRL